MGMTESALTTMTQPLQTCVSDVLGSFDCTLRSKCCEEYKCLSFYYHCRTTSVPENITTDDEIIINKNSL